MITNSKLSDIKNIRHGFFTRQGGVSTGIYASLNCGPGSADNKDSVQQNRNIVLQSLGINGEKICTLYQCHSNKVVHVDDLKKFDPSIQADAIVTTKKHIAIGVLTADCAPVLFSTTDGEIIGAAHAGWKGAIGGVLENTVAKMYGLGANHIDIVAVVGPCISGDSYEVGAEFRDNFLNDSTDNHKFFRMLPKKDKFLFNLPSYVMSRLENLGLGHVAWTGDDTLPDAEKFFSYRRTCLAGEKDYGRQISAIAKP